MGIHEQQIQQLSKKRTVAISTAVLCSLLFALIPANSSAAPITASKEYKTLNSYVKKLEKRKKATKASKKRYRKDLQKRFAAVSKIAQKNFDADRKTAWAANRQELENYKTTVWPNYQLQIDVTKAEIEGERIALKNEFNTEVREIRAEWAPAINAAKRKITRAKKKMRKSAFKKFRAQQNKKIAGLVKRREALVAERQAVYNNNLQQLNAQEATEIQEINNDFAEDWQGYDLELQEKFSGETLPQLVSRRDGDVQKARQLLDKGLAAIKAMK